MESAARTEEDFQAVVDQWDELDKTRERRERAHEVQRDEDEIPLEYGQKKDGLVFPSPIVHPAGWEMMKGDFLAMIYDNAEDIS